jgi:hypothetical protein
MTSSRLGTRDTLSHDARDIIAHPLSLLLLHCMFWTLRQWSALQYSTSRLRQVASLHGAYDKNHTAMVKDGKGGGWGNAREMIAIVPAGSAQCPARGDRESADTRDRGANAPPALLHGTPYGGKFSPTKVLMPYQPHYLPGCPLPLYTNMRSCSALTYVLGRLICAR